MADLTALGRQLQRGAATFLATLLGSYRVSQRALNYVVSGVNKLFDSFLELLKAKSRQQLEHKDGYISLHDIDNLLDSFKGQSLLEGVQTAKTLDSFLQEQTSHRPVIMKEIVLKSKTVWCRGIPKLRKIDYGYFVPFLPQLEQLLNVKDVLYCVDNPLPSQERIFRSITDGLMYRYHNVVRAHGNKTLGIVIYVDDVEVCDPLKSKGGKHNLRLFYWMLVNIYPEKRSVLRAINLLAIVKASVAKKYGNEHFLQDFIKVLQRLESGITLKINGVERTFYGVLVCACGDLPALANLGGFKESHFALRPCRFCMVTKGEICTSFSDSTHLLRKKEEYNQHVKEVMAKKVDDLEEVHDVFEDTPEDGEMDESPAGVIYADHQDPSVNFGINGRSILSEAPGFDPTKALCADVLHTLAEGVVEMVCRLLLRDACFVRSQEYPKRLAKDHLKLDHVNNIIKKHTDFGNYHRSMPSVIEKAHIKKKLKQSGAQMIVLAHLLPFVLLNHPHCSDTKLCLLTQVLDIYNISMSYILTLHDIEMLAAKVEEFGKAFIAIYPKVKTPKLHSLVHLAMQARLFGPLRQQSCFRFEAMHTQFTSVLDVVRSKVNVALSAGKRFILKRNAEIMSCKYDGSYLYSGDELKGLQSVSVSKLPGKSCLQEKFPALGEAHTLVKVEKLTRHGDIWEAGVIFYLGNDAFGRISAIYQIEDDLVFIYNKMVTHHVAALNSFEIDGCRSEFQCIKFPELIYPYPITKFSFSFPRQRQKSYLVMISSTVLKLSTEVCKSQLL